MSLQAAVPRGHLAHYHEIDAVQAFDMLRNLSPTDDIPMRIVAQQITDNP